MQRRVSGVGGWTVLLAAALAPVRGARAEVTPATTPPVLARDVSSAFAAAARAIGPAVVRIEVSGGAGEHNARARDDDDDGQGDDARQLLQTTAAGTASGIVI